MSDDLPPLVSETDWARTPPAVQAAFVELVALVQQLSAEVQDLRMRVNQTSKNSSKPPSSDPPSAPPPPARLASQRPRGAQSGHGDQQRGFLPSDAVQDLVILHPTTCPHCHTAVSPTLPEAAPRVRHQVWEVPPILATVTEYQRCTVVCPRCTQPIQAALPPDVPPGACGPRLTPLIALLHGRYRLSIRESVTYLADVHGVQLCTGSIVRSCQRVSTALAPVDQTIQATVQRQAHLHVDETTWWEQRQRGWLWVAVSAVATCFRIDASRGRQALQRLIGDTFGGLVSSDRGSAYTWVAPRQRQLCWAHLVRNLRGLAEADHADSACARQMLAESQALFTAWHAFQAGLFDRVALQMALLPVRLALAEQLAIGAQSGWPKLRRFARDLQRHWDALRWFSRVEDVEPTNNRAERALRPAVVWRKSCFGTQSVAGSRFVERMLSVSATCRQQDRPLFAFLTTAVAAAWTGHPAPCLFPAP